MKELTIEEKAEAYDLAIERAKKWYNVPNVDKIPTFGNRVIEEIFPELIKNDDEKIKEEIINYFRCQSRDEPCRKSIHDKWIAWLEKQKTSEEAMQYLKENHSPSEVSDFQTAMNIAVAKAYDKGVKDGLEKQGNANKAFYEIAEKEKFDFVSGQFIECRKSFNEFKEDNSYWLEYVGNDTYIGRSDNILNKKFHITPSQLYRWFTQQHCPKENNANEETDTPTEYGKYVDECLNEASKHFFSEGEDKYSVADLFYAGVRCGKSCLENKGKTFTKEDVDDAYLKGISDTKKELEKQGKSALEAVKEEKVDDSNKVEPKFRDDDWIVNNLTKDVFRIKSISSGFYLLEDTKGNKFSPCLPPYETDFHIWTINDANDGDVLVDAYGNIGIYKSHDNFTWKSYCSLGCNRGFKGFEVEHENDKTHPATKEQRDTLMKEWLPQDILLILKSKYKM